MFVILGVGWIAILFLVYVVDWVDLVCWCLGLCGCVWFLVGYFRVGFAGC